MVAEKCIIGAFILKADTGTRTSFASGKLLLRVCWLRGARGGFRTSQSVSLKHMVPTHKTTLLLSNCPGADVIPAGDRDNSGSCEFVNVFHRSRFVFLPCLTFFLLFLRARCGFWLGHLCVGRAHGVDQSISCRRGFPKAPLIYLIIFQEVTYYFWEEGGAGGCFCTSAVGGLYDGCAAVKQLACPVHTSAGHHESREPDSEVWYCDSTPGFICLYVGVWQPALQICWR